MRYLLLGYGISNQSIKKYFDKINICYDIYDDKFENNISVDINNYDYIVKTGGVSNDHFIIKELKDRKEDYKIITDLELFSYYNKSKELIVVTGTNGKSTTTKLLSLLLDAPYCGNIGIPLFDYIDYLDTLIIEVSSFMSEYIDKFKADIYVITNLYPNHLDYHHSYNEYKKAKLKLLQNINSSASLVYNDYNDDLKKELESLKCNKYPLSMLEIINNIAYIYDDELIDLNKTTKINTDDLLLSLITGYIKNIDPYILQNRVKEYVGLKYRMELIYKKNDLEIYNDSKSTNLYALNNSFKMFTDKLVLLICGGYESNNSLDYLMIKPEIVFCIGESKNRLFEYFKNLKIRSFIFESLEEAVKNVYKYKNEINVVLFSPGFQSYDQYKNFEERGRDFNSQISKYFII